jgi:hypothetical protein
MSARPHLFTLATVFVLSACASGPDLIDQQLASAPPEKHSYIIGTYAVSCETFRGQCSQAFNALSTHYRDTRKPTARRRLTSVVGSTFASNTLHDFVDQERGERGFHFCIALPAGTYAFHSFDFYNFAGGGSGFSLPTEHQFNLPFTLSEGEIAYLGRLKLTTTVRMDILGMGRPSPGSLQLSSDGPDMQALALQKCPVSVRGKPIRHAPLVAAIPTGTGLVEIENRR